MKENVKGINSDGNAVLTLVSMAHDVLGSLVLILYAIYIFSSCVCLFHMTEILKILDGGVR